MPARFTIPFSSNGHPGRLALLLRTVLLQCCHCPHSCRARHGWIRFLFVPTWSRCYRPSDCRCPCPGRRCRPGPTSCLPRSASRSPSRVLASSFWQGYCHRTSRHLSHPQQAQRKPPLLGGSGRPARYQQPTAPAGSFGSLLPSIISSSIVTSVWRLLNSSLIMHMQFSSELLGSSGGRAWSPRRMTSRSTFLLLSPMGPPSTEWVPRSWHVVQASSVGQSCMI